VAAGIRDVIVTAMSALRRLGIDVVRRYNRLETDLPERPLAEPVLFVANHGFGGLFDLNVFAVLATFDRLELDRPVTMLAHKLAWTLQVGRLLEPLGARPASRGAALDAFATGHHVLVMPGGDLDAFKSFADRNRIVFGGRQGFADVAITAGVPVVPIVTAGAGESLLVLSDGAHLARALRLDTLLRLKALPVSVSVPWGLNVGAVGLLPYLPLPTKLHTRVLDPLRPDLRETAEDFAHRVVAAMQQALDDLTAHRKPLLG
jgi:1-acyl-sn-glycerol-3-phosphate acyltransferase